MVGMLRPLLLFVFGAAVGQQQCYVCDSIRDSSENPVIQISDCNPSETCTTNLGYCYSVYANDRELTGCLDNTPAVVQYAQEIMDFHAQNTGGARADATMTQLVNFFLSEPPLPGFISENLLGTHTVLQDDLISTFQYQVCNTEDGSPCNVNPDWRTEDVKTISVGARDNSDLTSAGAFQPRFEFESVPETTIGPDETTRGKTAQEETTVVDVETTEVITTTAQISGELTTVDSKTKLTTVNSQEETSTVDEVTSRTEVAETTVTTVVNEIEVTEATEASTTKASEKTDTEAPTKTSTTTEATTSTTSTTIPDTEDKIPDTEAPKKTSTTTEPTKLTTPITISTDSNDYNESNYYNESDYYNDYYNDSYYGYNDSDDYNFPTTTEALGVALTINSVGNGALPSVNDNENTGGPGPESGGITSVSVGSSVGRDASDGTANPKFGMHKNENEEHNYDVGPHHRNNGSDELTNTDGLNRLDTLTDELKVEREAYLNKRRMFLGKIISQATSLLDKEDC